MGSVSSPLCGAILLLCLLVGAPLASAAAQAAERGIAISGSWMRAIIPSRPAAGYFTLSNDTAKVESLVGASSPACGSLMLHRSLNQNGQDRMAMVKSVAVPAHGTVTFAPGGYHLMCVSPSADVRPGHSVPVTLRFADGGTVTASFPVRGPAGR